MDTEFLNRLGIVLNFIAGFLIAPELIGLDRFLRLESFAEAKVTQTKNSLTQRVESDRKDSLIDWFLPFKMRYSTCLLITPILPLISTLAAWLVFLLFRSTMRLEVIPSVSLTAISLLAILVFFAYWPIRWRRPVQAIFDALVLLIYWPFTIRASLSYLTAIFIAGLARVVLLVLQGPDRLRAFMVSLGIILYISGNALQFVATFDH